MVDDIIKQKFRDEKCNIIDYYPDKTPKIPKGSNVLQPLMPNAVNRQQIQPGGTGELNEGTDLITPIDPNAQKGFISQEEQFGNVNALNPMMPPNPFDPDATGINSLYN